MNAIAELIKTGHAAILENQKQFELKKEKYKEDADWFAFICSLTILAEYFRRVNKQDWLNRLACYPDDKTEHKFRINFINEKIVFDVDGFIQECRKNKLDLGESNLFACPSILCTSLDFIRNSINSTNILEIDNGQSCDELVVSATTKDLDDIFFGEDFDKKIEAACMETSPGRFSSGEPLGKIYEKFRRTTPSDQ